MLMLLLQAVRQQPVAVGFFATDFLFYGGGVWTAARCDYPAGPPNYENATINHALLVVGFNLTATPPYWCGCCWHVRLGGACLIMH